MEGETLPRNGFHTGEGDRACLDDATNSFFLRSVNHKADNNISQPLNKASFRMYWSPQPAAIFSPQRNVWAKLYTFFVIVHCGLKVSKNDSLLQTGKKDTIYVWMKTIYTFRFVKMKTTYNFSEFWGRFNEKYYTEKGSNAGKTWFHWFCVFQENSVM